MTFVFVFFLLAIAAAAAYVPQARPFLGGMEPGEVAYLAVYGALAVSLAASLLANYRGRYGEGLRNLAVWCIVGLGAVSAYAFRDDLRPIVDRIRAEVVPGTVLAPHPGEALVARRIDGSFYLKAMANGHPLSFVFDTGATTVVLRAEDARRMGLPVKELRFNAIVATANGRARAAPVEIETLSVGGIVERRVQALVTKPGALHENLLGQTFLERLASYTVENNHLVLKGR